MKRIIAIILFSLGVLTGFSQNDVIITEFMAANDKTVADEDGDFPDWIEIYNAGTNTVDLNGWKLADRSNRWDFPATNLPPNQFMIVFASNKNRRIPGRPLHTNFRLDADPPEPVSLLRPDLSVASQFNPPIQVTDISYGIPVNAIPVTLVTTGAPAKFLVPPDANLGTDWTQPGFNDAAWTSVQNGVGFEADPVVPSSANVIADSVAEFSATQGVNNWYYGYWNKKDDTNGTYQTTDFIQFPRGTDNVLSATNYWNGTNWLFPPPNPPATQITSTGGQPAAGNGNPSAAVHWAIRRYIAEAAGQLRISGILAASGQSGACGDGSVGHIFVDGVEVYQRAVFNMSIGYSILVNASVGSVIDFAIEAGSGDNDLCDNTTFTAIVRSVNDLGVVADTITDWSDTGVQGRNNWIYGAFVRSNTTVTYTTARFGQFPSGSGPHSVNNFWNGEMWQWFDGDPPFDRIGQFTCQPSIFPATSSSTNAYEHQVIRRWVSEISGTLHIDWHIGKQDLTGGGVTARLMRNGAQVSAVTIGGGDFVGSNRTDVIANVQVGDLLDFSVEPGVDVVGDICFFNATIHGFTSVSNQFRSDVASAMRNINSSAYLRIPFTISNAFAFNSLLLRMKYDDGFNAYVNGRLVVSRNAPDPSVWNSAATAARVDADASEFEEFDLFRLAEDVLRSGNNVLAIQGLNSSAADGDFLIVAELKAQITSLDRTNQTYFYNPTPGAANGAGSAVLAPIITDVNHTPHDPADNEDLFVTARILAVDPAHPVAPNGVKLYYRVQFGNEVAVTMQDDGLNWDGVAGDGVYGGRVPNAASGPGQMIRYYITAADTNNNLGRNPTFLHPQFTAQYYGTVVKNPALTNPLQVLHMFITEANLNLANANQNGRYPCSLYFLGEFYDNLGINQHGQSSSGFPKKSYDIDFNADHHFLWDPNQSRVDDINLLTTYPDKSHMRNLIGYQIFRDAGAPHHYVVPVRVETNGGFYGDWHILENGDANYLKRLGRDPNGSLYKMYNTFNDPSDFTISSAEAEKKTRKNEGNTDLIQLYWGVNTNNLAFRTNYMFDNIDISEVLNQLAARAITSDWDCCHKNYYFYRDSDGDGEWEAMPWDIDLSFGHNWSSTQSYWDDTVYPENRIWGNWDNNGMFQVCLNMPAGRGVETTRRMYLRRVRTLMDDLQQTNGTPAQMLNFENQMDYWAALLTPDAAPDLVKWGSWGGGATGIFATNNQYYRTLPQEVAQIKTNYMPRRRTFVFNNRAGLGADWPDPQPANVFIQIASLDYNPSSGNQAEEYIRLVNTNSIEIDISGWQLAGAIEHTFQGGVVIPRGGGSVYVVPDKKAFRKRAIAPKGGMGLYVEGPYKGQLSARGETIYLSNRVGTLVSSNQYIGNPTPAQNALRVTEIMYHPTFLPSGPFNAEEYEYIELRNISAAPLNLNGIKFVQGIEFTFGNTVLAPGAYVLVVKNIAAFQLRYGPGFNIAGQYVGSLDNAGENLEIQDAVGEKVQDFSYNNSWYPITDGAGASLVIKNDQAPWDSWGLKASWRPSTYDNGTPGTGDTPAIVVAPVLVNEVLTHTDLPDLDKIELLNTNTSAVNIGGWFISDDFEEPKKFLIPNGTVIPAGGYIVFDENDFNPNPLDPASFAFSSLGDEAYLFSGDGTNITGYFHGFEFGAAENDVAFARYVDSVTNEHFVATSTNTFHTANAYPKVGPIVISEIMYHPAAYGDGADNSIEEFIEIHNLSTNAVPLYDVNADTNTWHLRGGVDFDFPMNLSMPAGSFAMLVNFNPTNTPVLDAFRARYNLSPSVPIYGPFDGRLNNEGDSVRLLRPDVPELDSFGNTIVPYILVDRVDYQPIEPWPLAAAGIGASLQRKVLGNFGNDPANWAGGLSPGANYGGTPPTITSQSLNLTTIEGHTLTMNVTATGSQPLVFQWRFNGNNIPGGGDGNLVIPNITTNQAGAYKAVIYNSAGSAESAFINVTVQFAPQFTLQPRSTNVLIGSNVTFTVAAESENGPNLTYQWWFRDSNGGDHLIPGATGTSYTLTGVKLSDDGFIYATVTDPVDTVSSQLARVRVLVQPFFVQLPISQFVPQGGSVTVSVAVTNIATQPITNRWRRIGGAQTNNLNFGTVDYFTVTNVQGSNRYDVIVFNEARPTGFQSPQFFIAAIADADGDGLPDQWELDNNVTDPNGDPDGDGMNNLAEYIAGTNPNDGQSYLKIDKLTMGPGATVRFVAISNKTYTVEYTDALGAGLWRRLADTYAVSNTAPVSVLDPSFTTNRFYRLATPRTR